MRTLEKSGVFIFTQNNILKNTKNNLHNLKKVVSLTQQITTTSNIK